MAEVLLATKFHIPHSTSELVPRKRLVEVLNTGLSLQHQLTLISAPAGYGKSTLVANWINSRLPTELTPVKFSWLSLDNGDNDPKRFLRYFIAGLQQMRPGLGKETLACLGMPSLPAVQTVLGPLVNELAFEKEKMVLVLDDYHLITSETVHDFLRFLIDTAPPSFQLVILTREDPPFPLSRLRARRQITELRASQLRFTHSEVELLFRSREILLTPDWFTVLETRTEGWVTGLLLAAISLKSSEDYNAFFYNFGGSHRLVFDYLIDEVLDHLPAEINEFLRITAILDRFCPALCEAVTGNKKSREILSQIERANLFLIPLDDQRIWFRYHHLFADILVADLEQSDHDMLANLHRRAADWLNNHGQPTSALKHALQAKDFAMAIKIVHQWIDTHEKSGNYLELVGWFNAIPDDALGKDLQLLYRKMRVFYRSGDYVRSEQVRTYLEQKLDGVVDTTADETRGLRVNILFEKAVFASMRGELEQANHYLLQAEQLVKHDNISELLQFSFYQGINFTYQGKFNDALQSYQTCLELNLKGGLYWNAANCMANMLDIFCIRGQFRLAIHTGEDFIDRHKHNLPVASFLESMHAVMGTAYYAINHLEQAEYFLRKTYDSSLISGSDDNFGGWRLWLAVVCNAQGKTEEAEDLIRKSEPWVAGFPGEQFKLFAGAIRTRIRLAQGSLKEPQSWAWRFSAEQNKPYFKVFQLHTLAWLWIVDGKAGDALMILESILPQVEACQANAYLVENLSLQALALQQLNRQADAFSQLHRSLEQARLQQQERFYFELGPVMIDLLSRLSLRIAADDPIQDILLRLIGVSPSFTSQYKPVQADDLIETLGGREFEILRLIAEGLSNKEVASRLRLSISTVKWYIYHLYEKLGVNSRTQAIQRARELKIL